ncbi:MAG: T9SS C-terminal target domain-containing protein, partial [Bacteroidetes bacterium]
PNPTFDFGASGTYPVQQIAFNICGADTFFLEVSVVRSSIDDLLDLSSLSIYPNPTQGDFALDMILRKPANVTVDVVNASGQVVLSQTFDKVSGNFSHEFVSNKLAAGLYIVRLNISGEQVLRKLQVE